MSLEQHTVTEEDALRCVLESLDAALAVLPPGSEWATAFLTCRGLLATSLGLRRLRLA